MTVVGTSYYQVNLDKVVVERSGETFEIELRCSKAPHLFNRLSHRHRR